MLAPLLHPRAPHPAAAAAARAGLKSGKLLKEFKGHTSFVSSVLFMPLPTSGGAMAAVSGSADATVRVWDMKTAECRSAIRIAHEGATEALEIAVTQVVAMPRAVEQLLVCSKACAVHLINVRGTVLRTYKMRARHTPPTIHPRRAPPSSKQCAPRRHACLVQTHPAPRPKARC